MKRFETSKTTARACRLLAIRDSGYADDADQALFNAGYAALPAGVTFREAAKMSDADLVAALRRDAAIDTHVEGRNGYFDE